MSNIIARVGSAIARNKKEASDILLKYKIANDGSFPDMIKKSFSAIKSGNKDLAADLAGLVSLDSAHKTVKPLPFTSKNGDVLADIKSKIEAKLALLKTNQKTGGSADGIDTAIEADSTELFTTVSSGDSDSLSGDAIKAANTVDKMPVIMVLALIVVVAGLAWLVKNW